MASKSYDFTLAAIAGASQRLDVRGNYCRLLASSLPVIVKADTGEEWELSAGQGFRLPASSPFSALTVRNIAGIANVGSLFIGDSSFEDSRITGDVSVIDAIGANSKIYANSATAIGFNVQAIVLPALNVRGVIVRQSLIESTPGGGGNVNVRLMGAPTAPVSISNTNVPAIILNTLFNGTAGGLTSSVFDSRRQLPIGWGLYYLSNVAVAIATQASMAVSAEVL